MREQLKNKFSVLIFLFIFLLSAPSFSLAVAPADQKYFNLTAEKIEVSPAVPMLNQTCFITVKVKNNSTITLTNSLGSGTFTYLFTDFSLTRVTYPTPSPSNLILPGAYLNYVFEGKFTRLGLAALSFTVDSTNELREAKIGDDGYTISLENDNQVKSSVQILADVETDLSVEPLSATILEPIINEPLEIKIPVKNIGKTTLDNKYGLDDFKAAYPDFKITSEKHDNFPTATSFFSPDGVINYYYSGYYVASGEKTFSYSVNSGKGLVEKSYTNNTGEIKFTVYPSTEVRDEFKFIDLNLKQLSTTSVLVSWKTDKPTTGRVEYHLSTTDNFLDAGVESGIATTSHSKEVNNLLAGKTYAFRIRGFRNSKIIESLTKDVTLVPDFKLITLNETQATSQNSMTNQITSGTAVNTSGSALAIYNIKDLALYSHLKGKILLKVEDHGKAYYVNPNDQKYYYLGRAEDAYQVMRAKGIGVRTSDLSKIPIGFAPLTGDDTDTDGLSDDLEKALGTDLLKKDTDGDGHDDKTELMGGFNPIGMGNLALDSIFAGKQKGKIFLQIETHGEAWYINPADGKRYFLGRAADAYAIMRLLSIGITNNDFNRL